MQKRHRDEKGIGTDKVTSTHVLESKAQQLALFDNFIKMNSVQSFLSERKLTFARYFMFSNQYHLDFAGYKITQHAKQPNPVEQAPPAVDEQTKKAKKQTVKALTNDIKGIRARYISMSKELKKLEVQRMAAGNKSRKFEKETKRRDAALYQALREARKSFNTVCTGMNRLLEEIHQKQSAMYTLNKQIRGEPLPNEQHTLNGYHFPPKYKSAGRRPRAGHYGYWCGHHNSMSAQQREPFPSLDGQQAGTISQGRMPPVCFDCKNGEQWRQFKR